jgi:hypothetical protein
MKKVFNDLEFEPHPMGVGIRAIMQFGNGYGVSVVRTPYTYGGDKDLYEVAVIDFNGNLCYDTPVTDDVIGYLRPEDVTDVMDKVQELPKKDNNPNLFEDGFIA